MIARETIVFKKYLELRPRNNFHPSYFGNGRLR
jgi:hypothetical protein